MRDRPVCSLPEEIKEASRGDYRIYKYKCKSMVQYGPNPYNVDHSTCHYQVRVGKEVLETFSDLEDATIHAGALFKIELDRRDAAKEQQDESTD